MNIYLIKHGYGTAIGDVTDIKYVAAPNLETVAKKNPTARSIELFAKNVEILKIEENE